jgi:hypothetical protein
MKMALLLPAILMVFRWRADISMLLEAVSIVEVLVLYLSLVDESQGLLMLKGIL